VTTAAREGKATYVVKDGEGSDDGIGKVDTSQATGPVGGREERHEGAANDTLGKLVTRFTSVEPGVGAADTYAGMMQAMMKAQRWDCLRIPNPTNRVKKMLTAPEGVFIRAARLES
jgi:hypothetical protein